MGIDYGKYPMENGHLPNRDSETGIRYGIIPLDRLADWVFEEGEPEYLFGCPECGQEMHPDTHQDGDQHTCCSCTYRGPTEEFWGEVCVGTHFDSDGVKATLAPDGYLWVFKSRVTELGDHCSPCVPGAVYLDGSEGNVRAYSVPREWLREEA